MSRVNSYKAAYGHSTAQIQEEEEEEYKLKSPFN
jgi:hypothetical protein